jgi:DNA-binding transcriptional ArsR family regulator
MEKTDAVAALAALAQDNRLDVFRLLVQAGPGGMSAGAIAEALDLPPNTLTFHFDRLRMAGLATARRALDDLRGAIRNDEFAARLSDRKLLRRDAVRARHHLQACAQARQSTSGVNLTFATCLTASPTSECQIQNSTGNLNLLVVL